MICTIGATKKSVELMTNSSLIDLNKAITKAEPGTGGQSISENNSQPMNNSVSANNQIPVEIEEDNTAESVSDNVGSSSVTISVRDTTIKLDGTVVSNPDKLKMMILEKYASGISITLVDDYAKASVFREVIGILTQLKETGNYDFQIV